jgi:hypothetical protein
MGRATVSYSAGTPRAHSGPRTGWLGQAPAKAQGRPKGEAPNGSKNPETVGQIQNRCTRRNAPKRPPSPQFLATQHPPRADRRPPQGPDDSAGIRASGDPVNPAAGRVKLANLASEWTLDVRVLGRSPRTIGWYEQKIDAFLGATGLVTVSDLTAYELKRDVLGLQDQGRCSWPSWFFWAPANPVAAQAASHPPPVHDALSSRPMSRIGDDGAEALPGTVTILRGSRVAAA